MENQTKNYQIAIWKNTAPSNKPIKEAVWEKQFLDPMTGPEIVAWSKFHRFNFVISLEEPLRVDIPVVDPMRISFEVHKTDNSPLNQDDLNAFLPLQHKTIASARQVVLSMSPAHRNMV